jgi:hypothetical protein
MIKFENKETTLLAVKTEGGKPEVHTYMDLALITLNRPLPKGYTTGEMRLEFALMSKLELARTEKSVYIQVSKEDCEVLAKLSEGPWGLRDKAILDYEDYTKSLLEE